MLRRCKCSGVHSRSRRLGAKAMRCAVVAWSCDVRTRRGRDDEFLTSSMWPRLLTSSLWPRPTDGARFFFSRKRALPRVARCSAAILPHSAARDAFFRRSLFFPLVFGERALGTQRAREGEGERARERAPRDAKRARGRTGRGRGSRARTAARAHGSTRHGHFGSVRSVFFPAARRG